MIKKIKNYWPYLLSFFSGAALTLSFAPYYQSWLAFFCPIGLLYTTRKLSAWPAFKQGFVFGCGFFGFGVYWIFHSIFYYGQTSAWLAYLITGLFVLYLALFPAIMIALTNRYFSSKNLQRASVIFPAMWVIFEMVRGYFLTGFPWLFLGTSQLQNSAFSAYASVGSVWLVSWMVALSSGLLYSLIEYASSENKTKKHLYGLVSSLIMIWIIGATLDHVQWTKPETLALRVALVQGNIPQQMRWTPEHVATIMNKYESLTLPAFDKADIVIWPEGAIPLPLPYSNKYFKALHTQAETSQTALLVGVPEKVPNQESYYNAIVGMGLATGAYYKERLVPFGEFVPFEKMLRGLIGFFDLPMSSFVAKTTADSQPLAIFGLNVAAAICYEIAFPTIVQKNSLYSDFIVTVSNDTWFGKTIGPQQHLEIAKWRALETGRYVLRATNSGLTAIIDPKGETYLAHPYETTVLYGEVYPMTGHTPWVRWGISPLMIALLIVFLIGFRMQLIAFIFHFIQAMGSKGSKPHAKKASQEDIRRERRQQRRQQRHHDD